MTSPFRQSMSTLRFVVIFLCFILHSYASESEADSVCSAGSSGRPCTFSLAVNGTDGAGPGPFSSLEYAINRTVDAALSTAVICFTPGSYSVTLAFSWINNTDVDFPLKTVELRGGTGVIISSNANILLYTLQDGTPSPLSVFITGFQFLGDVQVTCAGVAFSDVYISGGSVKVIATDHADLCQAEQQAEVVVVPNREATIYELHDMAVCLLGDVFPSGTFAFFQKMRAYERASDLQWSMEQLKGCVQQLGLPLSFAPQFQDAITTSDYLKHDWTEYDDNGDLISPSTVEQADDDSVLTTLLCYWVTFVGGFVLAEIMRQPRVH